MKSNLVLAHWAGDHDLCEVFTFCWCKCLIKWRDLQIEFGYRELHYSLDIWRAVEKKLGRALLKRGRLISWFWLCVHFRRFFELKKQHNGEFHFQYSRASREYADDVKRKAILNYPTGGGMWE